MILVAVVAATAYAAARGGTLAEVTQPASAAICDNVTQHSGYFKLTTGRKHYFYWFFESRSAPKTDPLVLWMTGGPGCSSEVALFGENGPCSVNAAGTGTIRNKYSWNTRANLVYIDQPAGTGFSYGSGLDHDEAGVARDMYDFLQQLLQAHPTLQPLDFYVVGESYAGHYVPAVTHEVWANNKALPSGAIRINLKGTSVGNGLVAPEIQYQYYKDMVISTNGHKPAVGNLTHAAMQAATPACIAAIKACQAVAASCLVAIEVCNAALLLPYQASGMNVYDMREPCAKPPLCYDFSNVATYLDRAEVRAALGVGQRKWSDCNHAVALGFELSGDWMQSYEKKLPDQLGDGVRVLIYAGDQDYICNWLGNQAWAQAMPWPHRADFAATKPVPWMAGGKQAGTLQSSHGFSFLRVYDAGHMVPRDQPANALAMLHAFLDGEM